MRQKDLSIFSGTLPGETLISRQMVSNAAETKLFSTPIAAQKAKASQFSPAA